MDKILIVLLALMVGVVFINVVTRYLGSPIRWADEVARLTFVWIAFIGMYIGYKRKSHPSFSLLVKSINKRNKTAGKIFHLIIHFSVMFFLFIIIYGGYLYIERAWVQTTAVLRISVGWKYMAAPVGCFLMFLEAIKNILLVFRKEKVEFKQKLLS